MRVLHKKSTHEDGIAAKVQQFIAAATPMVDLVAAGPFRNFTLHNRDHAKKLIHLSEHLVPPESIAQLTALECLFIVYSAFLHDMGMAITQTERENILRSSEYQDTLRSWPSLNSTIQRLRKYVSKAPEEDKAALEALIYQLHEAGLTAYLRPRHATHARYHALVDHLRKSSGQSDLFSLKGVPFEEILIDICASHNLDAATLIETRSAYEDRFPRDLIVSHHKANTQFCAALLRLTDILDFDRERTPSILFESLGLPNSDLPGAEVSIREWEKHMAIHTLDFREDEIVVCADCTHPAIERTIRDFCQVIEREIKDTVAVANRGLGDSSQNYRLALPLSVRPRITSRGYIYSDVSLRLNQSAIISLLMGERLYANSSVAIRELLQNALDACAVRAKLEPVLRYTAQITITSTVDQFSRTWIEIEDNGIGMDDHVIGEYLLRLGDSYYDSPEFQRQFSRLGNTDEPFRAISRFGIGILSVFMLADALEVQTKSDFSPRSDSAPRLVRIERLGGIAFIAPGNRTDAGTRVRIRLRQDIKPPSTLFSEINAYLRNLLIRPQFLIRVALEGDRTAYYLPGTGGDFYTAPTGAIEKAGSDGYKIIPIDLGRWSNRLSGVAIVALAVDDKGLLTNRGKTGSIRIHENPKIGNINPKLIAPDYKGNRISVNGFRLMSFKTKNLLALGERNRLSFILDLNVRSDDEIEYDVSRERLTSRGEKALREEIKKAVLGALTSSPVVDMLSPDLATSMLASATHNVRNFSSSPEAEAPDAIRALFAVVQSAIPKTHWPNGMHHKIATDLGITSSLASKVISKLLSRGLISNPNKPPTKDV